MFINKFEKEINRKYLKNGYLIAKVENKNSLEFLKNFVENFIKKEFKIGKKNCLDDFHKVIRVKNLNDFRIKLINKINKVEKFREVYYEISKKYLDAIVGNELSMQKRLNLSIQLPGDSTSLLPVHSDTWSGDSPFETVVWLPLVDCSKTKSMYILTPNKLKFSHDILSQNLTTEKLFKKIKKSVNWIDIKYGEVLIFNQNLPHGNVINKEKDTRWSFNCRFKSIFAPYGDKKIGEFFEPISLKPASKIGMKYKYPKIK